MNSLFVSLLGSKKQDLCFYFPVNINLFSALCPLASASEKTLPPVQDILKGILKKIPKSRRFQNQDWDTTPRSRIRVTLGVPFVYRLYQMKKNEFLKAKYGKLL